MARRVLRRRRLAAAAAMAAAVAGVAATLSGGGAADANGGRSAAPASLSVSIGPGAGRPIPAGFLGFSFEFQAVRAYTGADPRAVNPVLVALIRNLTPGQAPVLRIGGDSTDISYVPAPGIRPPSWVDGALTPSWMATTGALAHELGARLILGLNLAANDPALAAAEARAYATAFGADSIDALEIGNEPNVYEKIHVAHTVLGLPVTPRPLGFGYRGFHPQFDAVAASAPGGVATAGPALAVGPVAGPGSWVQSMPSFLHSEPRLSLMTVHRYPLRNCNVGPRDPQYPSIAHLLAPYATVDLARSLVRWVRIAHRAGRQIRVDELNSVACRGMAGVSDTFACALWATDALFALARAGVDGVNMHTLPGAAYQLFQFTERGGRWQARVPPIYYGLQLFSQAAPAGSRLLDVSRRGSGGAVSVWATRAFDGTVRVVLINKSRAAGAAVSIATPTAAGTSATVERMTAPSARATSGAALGGRSYGAATTTGRLAAPVTTPAPVTGGRVTVSVPRASAALVTFPPAR